VKLITFFITLPLVLMAQNFQLHYDLGSDRRFVTTTFEMFKPDEYGSTFMFIDFDYDRPGNKSISLAYIELSRYIHSGLIKDLSFSFQYNDGTAPWGPLGHVWLVGISYPLKLGFMTLNLDVLHRYDVRSQGSAAQLTFSWFHVIRNHWQFAGFFDIWSAKYQHEQRLVVLAEPQFWYLLMNHLAFGSELEISKNFLPTDKWEIKPTVALKWIF